MSATRTPRALALVGMTGSGKSTCAQALENRGFFQFRFGSIVTDEVERRGQPINPHNERVVREELRETYGMDVMAKFALPKLTEALQTRDCIVIDGLYSWSEYRTLKQALDAELIVVAVVAERTARYNRLEDRTIRPLTHAEAEQRDWQEIEALEKGGPIAIADYTLNNDGAEQDLLGALEALLIRLNFTP
jgi:dephospho-CoA kinase